MLGWTKTKDFNLTWLRKDLAAVDRERTPWLIAVIHPPWCAPGRNHNLQIPMSAVDGRHGLLDCVPALICIGNPSNANLFATRCLCYVSAQECLLPRCSNMTFVQRIAKAGLNRSPLSLLVWWSLEQRRC